MSMTQSEIIAKLSEALNYIPIVYKQSSFYTDRDEYGKEFVLEFKQLSIPDDSLLLFVPSVSSTGDNCKLIVRVPKANSQGSYEYTNVEFNIIVETNDNLPRPAGRGDIIANRMCIFRFRRTTNEAILCNSPLYNDAVFNNITVTNAKFINKPEYVNPNNPSLNYVLIASDEYNALLDRVSKLEAKIKFGTLSPEEALADAPSGTIYIQHEED